MTASSFPVIEWTEGDISRQLDEACRTVGFFAVVGHGVPQPVIDHAWSAATRFFDLPLDEKLSLRIDREDYPYGYSPVHQESLEAQGETAGGDLNESFSISPPRREEVAAMGGFDLGGRMWPNRPGDFKGAWSKYYGHMEFLAARLMRECAVALGMPPGFFDDKIDRHLSALRALNYPPQRVVPAPGQIRAGAHTDYGTLTILLPGPATGGLEVMVGEDEWLPVPPIADGFIVNLGDLMAMWTNDRWRSTLHRVVNPAAEVAATERRQSMAFFHQPNWDAEVSALPTCVSEENPARYKPVRSGPWLKQKFAAAQDHD